jgi:hypothetical protein
MANYTYREHIQIYTENTFYGTCTVPSQLWQTIYTGETFYGKLYIYREHILIYTENTFYGTCPVPWQLWQTIYTENTFYGKLYIQRTHSNIYREHILWNLPCPMAALANSLALLTEGIPVKLSLSTISFR